MYALLSTRLTWSEVYRGVAGKEYNSCTCVPGPGWEAKLKNKLWTWEQDY